MIYRVDEADPVGARISTGTLPARREVDELLDEAYRRYRNVDDGAVADYIPALARTSPSLFGASIVSVAGEQAAVGDSAHPFSIQSVSKPFVFALVVEAVGADQARELLGVNATGLPFSSVMAVELNENRTINPMVNAGAIAASSLASGSTADAKWTWIQEGLSRFAGRPLDLDEEVYESEAATNLRNQGIAHLLQSYDRLYFDPEAATDIYTRQCSLLVTAEDLAVMAATLADGGVNPRSGVPVVSPATCHRVLSVMATAGLYENTGDWMYEVGLPGKSGVSGGIVTVAPGKGGMATFSPPLDEAGNSVRGQLVTRFLSHRLGLNIFASAPHAQDRGDR